MPAHPPNLLMTHMSWNASFKGGFNNLAYGLPLSHYCSGESQEVRRGFTVVGVGLYCGGGVALLWWGGVLLWWEVGLYSSGRWDFTVVGVGLYYGGKGLQDFLLGVLYWSSDGTLSVLTT